MGEPARIDLRLLGPFECVGPDGVEIAVQAAKQRGVLAYLALARGKRAPRGELASLFWSGSADAQARQSLRQCLSSLRKALGEGVLVSDATDVGFDLTRVHVDLDEVLGGLSLLEDAPACGPSRYVRGPLLPGLVFGEDPADDFLRDARVRLQDAGTRLLLRCASQQARAGEDQALVETWWRLLELCPACEEAHRGLMEVYARLGRRSEALAQYQACEDALRRHLDAAPAPETVALYDKLRAAADATEAAAPAPRAATLPLPDKPAIAVMPFENLSADPARDYLCDGFAEDITTALSQFSSLCVMSRSATFALRGQGLTPQEIGRQLGVHYILQGSVQLSGERVRVSTQLVDAEQATQLCSQRNDGRLRDVFDFQDELVQRVVATVAGRVEAAALARARRKATDDLDAYECVLRGRYHHHRYTPEDSEKAVAFFEEALKKKPDYVLARGWLSCAIARLKNFEQGRADRMNSKRYMKLLDDEFRALKQIESIDDEETECLRLIGELYLFRRRYDDAEHYLRRAYALNPNDDRIQSQLAALLCFLDDQLEAERFARMALRSNPFHPSFYQFNLGRVLMLQQRYGEAIEALRAATPTQNRYRCYLAACYAALGDEEAAARVRDEIYAEEPGFSLDRFAVTFIYRDAAVSAGLRELMERAGLR